MAKVTLVAVECARCGVLFVPVKSFQVRCSRQCTQLARNERQAAEWRAAKQDRKCLYCGTMFTPVKNQARCSARCKRLGSNAREVAKRLAAATRYERECVHCGSPFATTLACHFSCSARCTRRAYVVRQSGKTEKKRPAPKRLAQLAWDRDSLCAQCGTPFRPKTWNQIRCSPQCTRLARQMSKAAARAARAAARAIARRGGLLPPLIPCATCRADFKPGCTRARYCTPRCRSRGRDANRARRWKIKRQAIYDRDDGICQICGSLIDLNLRHPHSKSFTIDHIVPVSAGGIDHESNLQAAHMDCNAGKGGLSRYLPITPVA